MCSIMGFTTGMLRAPQAKEFFDKCVADEKKSNPLMDSENKAVTESEDYFQIYEGGFYNSNRYEITIVGRKVH